MTQTLPPLDEKQFLQEKLCCPGCGARLSRETPAGPTAPEGSLRCSGCNTLFPSAAGIPDLFQAWTPTPPPLNDPFEDYVLTLDQISRWQKGDQRTFAPQNITDPSAFCRPPAVKLFVSLRVMAWGLLLAPLVVPGWAGKTIPLAILFFVGDFFRSWYYRKDLFRRSLAVLRHMAETGQLHEARNNQILSQIDDTTGPPPEDRSADIREALTGVELNGKDVLHLGCGGAGEADINGVYLSGGARLMGVDIFVPFVKAFRAHFSPHAVLADALRLPFQKESVDIVNCTDIIEHVHDPKRFLQENLRIMKPGGFLLIITPNSCRARGSLDILNPLSLAASIWGSHQPQCRFPGRDLLGFYGNYVFYHTSYTARGLRDLIESSGLECRYVRVRAYRGGAKRWRRLLEKWPGVRWANDSLFALARKPVLPKK